MYMEGPAPVLARHAAAGGVAAALRQLPPGFRFRPTDEELVLQYLRRKAHGVPLPAAVIPVVPGLHGLDPWDIPGASGGEKYFFAVRPAGGERGSRPAATASGRWKPAGKEKPVVLSRPCGGRLVVGVKRAMTFKPRGTKAATAAAALSSGWVMHEYRLAAPLHKNGCGGLAQAGGSSGEWVVCRVFQRSRPRRRPARPPSPSPSPSSTSSCVTADGSSDQEEASS